MKNKNEAAEVMGEMLKKLREARNLSQSQFSEITGISQTTISKIENGKWNFTIEFIFEYLEKLNFYMFFEEKEADTTLAKAMRDRWLSNHSEN